MTAAGDAPSLFGQAARALRRRSARVPSPGGYGAALAVLAAIPGITAALAIGLASSEAYRNDRLARLASGRIAAIAETRRNAEARAATVPYFAVPTLTGALVEVVAALPQDAVLGAIARDRDGTIRIDVDTPDPDALRRAFRPPSSRRTWRSVAQSVTAGAGIRVTLEARGW